MIPGEAVTLAQVRASLLVNCRVQVQAIPSSVIAFSWSLPPKKKTSSSGTVIYVVSIYIYIHSYIRWYKSLKTQYTSMFLAFFWLVFQHRVCPLSADPILHHITHDLDFCFSIHTLSTLRTLCSGFEGVKKKNSLLVLRFGGTCNTPQKKWGKTYLYTWHHWRFPVPFVDVFPLTRKKNQGRVQFQPRSTKISFVWRWIPKNLE